MALATERRRILFRLSLVLNVILIAGPFYAILKGGSPLPAQLADTSLDRAWNNAIGVHNHDTHDLSPATVGEKEVDVDVDARKGHSPAPPAVLEGRQCGICEAGDSGRELCNDWGEHAMERAVAYSGTNSRLRRVLSKMRRGEPFSLGIVGGSVSAGHGMHSRGGDGVEDNIMHNVFFKYLNERFPQPGGTATGMSASKYENGGQNVFHNGAQPARGSDYFSMCLDLHMPKDVDLIIVELAINDPPHKAMVATFENLLRVIYDLPSQPAILMLNTFALKFDEIAMGGDLNLGAAQFYDTPVVSTRNVLLPFGLADKSLLIDWFGLSRAGAIPDPVTLDGVDLRHFGPKLHIFSGKLMSAYIDQQLCEMDRLEQRKGTSDLDALYPIDPLPPSRLMDKYKVDEKFPKLVPFCRATNSDEFPLTPKSQTGWESWAWKDKKYLRATEAGAKVSFEFNSVVGKVILYYLRSYNFGLGNLKCWIDDDKGTAQILEGYWTEPFNIGRTTMWSTTSGKHLLNCEVEEKTSDPNGGHEFRLMAIMSM